MVTVYFRWVWNKGVEVVRGVIESRRRWHLCWAKRSTTFEETKRLLFPKMTRCLRGGLNHDVRVLRHGKNPVLFGLALFFADSADFAVATVAVNAFVALLPL